MNEFLICPQRLSVVVAKESNATHWKRKYVMTCSAFSSIKSVTTQLLHSCTHIINIYISVKRKSRPGCTLTCRLIRFLHSWTETPDWNAELPIWHSICHGPLDATMLYTWLCSEPVKAKVLLACQSGNPDKMNCDESDQMKASAQWAQQLQAGSKDSDWLSCIFRY